MQWRCGTVTATSGATRHQVPDEEQSEKLRNIQIKIMRKYKTKTGDSMKNILYRIPHSWWEPVIWWLKRTKWSASGIGEMQEVANRGAHKCTWIEMLLLFQAQTGFRLDNRIDLWQQEQAFKSLINRIMQITKVKHHGKSISAQDYWFKASAINSCKYILGHARPGVCRRPVAEDAEWKQVASILHDAYDKQKEKAKFGTDYYAKFKIKAKNKWVSTALHLSYAMIDKFKNSKVFEGKKEATPSNEISKKLQGPCFFGHQTSSAMCLLKVARLRNGPHHDSSCDGAAYLALGCELDEGMLDVPVQQP